MITLGIETSCDETALALIETRPSGMRFECRVISSLVHSQAELHSAYGGVYPNLAKREHGKNIVALFERLLSDSAKGLDASIDSGTSHARAHQSRALLREDFNEKIYSFHSEIESQNPELFQAFSHAEFLKTIPTIDRIAVTEGPGLEPALWVGINFARMLGKLWNIPVVPVNHMEGHIVGSLLENDRGSGEWQTLKTLSLPALAFLLSGGHTQLVRVDKGMHYSIIGETKDDAVGEAFDKAARLLGLPYPGGPQLSRLAREAETDHIASEVTLPRPMLKSGDLNFSFSGLKTAVLYAVRAHANADSTVSEQFKKGLALEFEKAVTETLDAKLRRAIEAVNAHSIIIGGGVSANVRLREQFQKTADEFDLPLYLPTKHISGDNALMIALAGALNVHSMPNESRPLIADGTKRLGSNAA